MAEVDWDNVPYFTRDSFRCTETGKVVVDPKLVEMLVALREKFGPIPVTSGYRDPSHPIEAKKVEPGFHAHGIAVDCGIPAGQQARDFVRYALDVGFSGVGVSQREGRPRFIHLDIADRLAIYSY